MANGMNGQSPEALKAMMQMIWEAGAPGYSEWVIDKRMILGMYDRFEGLLAPALEGKPAGTVRILDLASATGEPAATLAAALPGADVLSTDVAAAYLELGKARLARLGLTNLSFETADGQDLSRYVDDQYDAVTVCLGLMYMPAYQAALQNIARVLKPGGIFAATAWQPADKVPCFNLINEVAQEYDPSVPDLTTHGCRFGDPAQLLADISAAGLTDVQCEGIEVTFTMPAGQWWDGFMKMPLPLAPALMKASQERPGQDLFAEAKAKLAKRMAEEGWLDADEALTIRGNQAWWITAAKP